MFTGVLSSVRDIWSGFVSASKWWLHRNHGHGDTVPTVFLGRQVPAFRVQRYAAACHRGTGRRSRLDPLIQLGARIAGDDVTIGDVRVPRCYIMLLLLAGTAGATAL